MLSKSRVLCYCQCPLKYKLDYIDQLPRLPNVYMNRGKMVHDILDKFFGLLTPTTTEKDFIPILKTQAGNDWEKLRLFLRKFAQMESRRWLEEKYFMPVMREAHIKAIDENGTSNNYIDRIDKLNDGSYAIIDYKTSNKPIVDIKEFMYELVCYAYLAKKEFDLPINTVKLYALKTGKELVKKITEDDIAYMLTVMKKVEDAIATKKFFKRENEYCGYCDHLLPCNAGRFNE